MGFEMLDELMNLGRDIGRITDVAMVDDKDVFIQGKTDGGDVFTLEYRVKEKKDDTL